MRKPLLALTALSFFTLSLAAHAQAQDKSCLAMPAGIYKNQNGKPFRVDVDCRRLVLTDLDRGNEFKIDLDATNEFTLATGTSEGESASALTLRMGDMKATRLNDDTSPAEINGMVEATVPLEKMAGVKSSQSIRLTFRAPFRVNAWSAKKTATFLLTLDHGLELAGAEIPLAGAMKKAFLSGANTILELLGTSITGRVHERLTFTGEK